MNTAKSDASFSSKRPDSSRNAGPKSPQKNIREIYLESVNRNRGDKKGSKLKTKNISHIAKNPETSKASSNYLENEYSLVKKILTATKALEKLKTDGSKATSSVNVKSDGNAAATRASVSAFRNKTQEEYYAEVLELKKTLKLVQNNETIAKSKLEYYENELNKKEQEILSLLDYKKEESSVSSRSFVGDKAADSLEAINLKIKAYKLEFSLKRKEAELNRMKADMKVTNVKELKAQNERLRLELSKALVNDQKVLEAQEMLANAHGVLETRADVVVGNSEQMTTNTEMAKHNIAKRLQKSETYADSEQIISSSKLGNFKEKLTLRGGIKEQLEQLDHRETQLLEEIARLNKLIEMKKSSSRSASRSSLRRSRESIHSTRSDKNKQNAVKMLQQVMKGHLERSRSLNNTRDKSLSRSRSESPQSIARPSSRLRDDNKSSRGSVRAYDNNSNSQRYDRPTSRNSNHLMRKRTSFDSDGDYDEEDNRSDNNSFASERQYRPASTKKSNERSRQMIDNKHVTDDKNGVCCSPWRSFV